MALPKPKLLRLLLQTQLPLLTLILLLANMKVHSRETTFFIFDTFESNPTDLIYQGDTHVPSGSSYLRLVKTDSSGVPQRYSVGRVLYSPPVNFWDSSSQASFETGIKFQIKPTSGGEAADGLAFFIAPVSTIIPDGSYGANLGIYDPLGKANSLFAVEFDVYADGEWDPSYPHVGINIDSINSSAVTRFEGALGQVVTTLIYYDSNTKTITVRTDYGSKSSTFSYVHDLKNTLPQQVRVGISASTGALVANFDLLSWFFTSILEDTANNDENGGAFIRQHV